MLYQLSYFRIILREAGGSRSCLQKHQSVGADGFEPPKSKDSRFTVCPIWPLWNTPKLFSLNLL